MPMFNSYVTNYRRLLEEIIRTRLILFADAFFFFQSLRCSKIDQNDVPVWHVKDVRTGLDQINGCIVKNMVIGGHSSVKWNNHEQLTLWQTFTICEPAAMAIESS